jgi:type I restriction enzyme S subunit
MNTKKLRQKILDLAIHGKLVAQNPNDEPASELLKRIRAEKEQLIKEGKIKKTKTTDSSHYENVPFEIPNSWEWTTLGEISNYGDNKNIQVENIGHTDWVLELEDIEKDSGNIVQYIHKSERKINGTRHKFSSGDILYSKLRTYLNKVLIAPNNGYCTTEIIPFGTHGILSNEYICHVLRSPYFLDYTIQCGYGVKMPRLSTTDACNGMIPLPPLAEQKRIVEAIDKWFALIDSIENNKADLETIIKQTKSKILDLAIHGKLVAQNPNDEPASELLKRINPKAEIISNSEQYGNLPFDIPKNWCWCKLSNISNIYTGNSINENEKKSQYTDVLGTEYIATKDVEFDNSINYKNGISIPEKYIKNFRIAPANSVLMCIEGGSAGRKIGILSQSVCFGNKLCCFSPHTNDISSMYIFYYLQSPLFFEIFNSNKNGIIGGVSINNLKKLLFPLPPLEEQKRIVEAIDKAFKYLDAIAESL